MRCQLMIRYQGQATLKSGFGSLRLSWQVDGQEQAHRSATLPPHLDLASRADTRLHNYLLENYRYARGIRPITDHIDPTQSHSSGSSFAQHCQDEVRLLEDWLSTPTFDQPLRDLLGAVGAAGHLYDVVVQTNSAVLQSLLWEEWSFVRNLPLQDRPAVLHIPLQRSKRRRVVPSIGVADEVARSTPLRVLMVLGQDGTGELETRRDRDNLGQILAGDADIELLVEPTIKQLVDTLAQGWQIVVFSGHGDVDDTSGLPMGRLKINSRGEDECYASIADLGAGIKLAVERGLGLLILNSCDGVAFALNAIEQGVQLPQTVAMGMPIIDAASVLFFKSLLENYRRLYPLPVALAMARDTLRSHEREFPGAWITPVLVADPQMPLQTWEDLQRSAAARQMLESEMTGAEPVDFWARHRLNQRLAAAALVGAMGVGVWAIAGLTLPPVMGRWAIEAGEAGLEEKAAVLYGLQMAIAWHNPWADSEDRATGHIGQADNAERKEQIELATAHYYQACYGVGDAAGCLDLSRLLQQQRSLTLARQALATARKRHVHERNNHHDNWLQHNREVAVSLQVRQGELDLADKSFSLARQSFEGAIAQGDRFQIEPPRAYCGLARAWQAEGNSTQARPFWQKTFDSLHKNDDRNAINDYRVCLSEAALALQGTAKSSLLPATAVVQARP